MSTHRVPGASVPAPDDSAITEPIGRAPDRKPDFREAEHTSGFPDTPATGGHR
ncbi:hypothetical protein [Streptomyces sp. NPDC049915]|uniref:hypothetical protein n=1 Tax=Streptomyces sp. NPDC049915 TaxID=3155510 RepID=UPI0034448A58